MSLNRLLTMRKRLRYAWLLWRVRHRAARYRALKAETIAELEWQRSQRDEAREAMRAIALQRLSTRNPETTF